jgi:hypothetical protein
MSEIINQILSNDVINIFLTISLGMLVGGTIRPMPKNLMYLFVNSFLFKYIILVLFGFCRLYPLDNNKIIKILIISFILLYFIEFLQRGLF